MLAYIKGTLEYIGEDAIIIDNGGMGYEVRTSLMDIQSASEKGMGSTIKMNTYLYVREDEMSLYGFIHAESLEMFKLLIAISGIGPKAALSILSILSPYELKMAVISQDSKAISKANGIGAKTAARVIIELKDKIKLDDLDSADFDIFNDISDDSSSESVDTNDSKGVIKEVSMALTNLGYSNVEALRAIKKVKGAENMTESELLKAALRTFIS